LDNFYHDNSDEDNTEEEDVTPNYFRECQQLDTTMPGEERMAERVPCLPLYQGSKFTAKDLARFILAFKARHLKVGDGLLANIVAMMATFLPNPNAFVDLLPEKTSIYYLLKKLHNLAAFKTNLRTIKIHTCPNKCIGYYAERSDLNFCSKCNECRWKLCSRLCYNATGDSICNHSKTPRKCAYYNVVQDRLVKLLKSDLRNMFEYENHRGGEVV
jgi:hypothetical protein